MANVAKVFNRRGQPLAVLVSHRQFERLRSKHSHFSDLYRKFLEKHSLAATWHGEERARLQALGRPAPFVEGQIAAIAHARGLVLVTTNETDFGGFRGLTVENWSKARPRTTT